MSPCVLSAMLLCFVIAHDLDTLFWTWGQLEVCIASKQHRTATQRVNLVMHLFSVGLRWLCAFSWGGWERDVNKHLFSPQTKEVIPSKSSVVH